jgi:hypothetical protein
MHVHHGYVKEKLITCDLGLKYIKTTKLLADALTKPPGGDLLHSTIRTMLGMSQRLSNRDTNSRSEAQNAENDVSNAVSHLPCSSHLNYKHCTDSS